MPHPLIRIDVGYKNTMSSFSAGLTCSYLTSQLLLFHLWLKSEAYEMFVLDR